MPADLALHIGFDSTREITILTLEGVLGVVTAPKLRDALLQCIAEQPAAVVVDVAHVCVQHPATLSLFGAVARRTEDWDGVRLVLATGASVDDIRLETRGIARLVPVYPTVDAALAEARLLQPRRIVRHVVPRDVQSLVPVGVFVGSTCDEWGCGSLADDVRLITHELVSSAHRHARTDATVRLHLRRPKLTIAVSDGSPNMPAVVRAEPGLRIDRFGLVIVDGLSRHWGVAVIPSGKVVWADILVQSS